ncbi:MAG: hypothetical protein AAGG08_03410, partial [Actinomycetota bacterium]
SDYTLRFEGGALVWPESFPEVPIGGVWEIVVVDGVAEPNEWSETEVGDTVDDWFDYVESQLDSFHLLVEFDEKTGHPTLIDSQPDDDGQSGAWLLRAEIVPTT